MNKKLKNMLIVSAITALGASPLMAQSAPADLTTTATSTIAALVGVAVGALALIFAWPVAKTGFSVAKQILARLGR